MKINSFLKSGIGILLFLLSTNCANGGPPLQSAVPMGLFPSKEGLALEEPSLELSGNNGKFSLKDEEDETHRLPLAVQPIHYDLEIRPILDGTGEEQFTAPGKVTIRVKCYESTTSITLHSKEIEIQHDQITVVGVDPEENISVTGHTVDETRSFYIIHLGRSLTEGKVYLLTIPFTSSVAQDRLNGLYLSSYKAEDGTTKYLATTQFQKRDASKAFPCFDEPSTAFRATFNVTIGRKAEGFHSLANTERVGLPQPIPGLEGWVWDRHATTVNMPVYLVAIIVSDFTSETAPEGLYTKPVKTWAPPPLMTETSGKFSAQAAARILTFFEQYFDFPYQLNKMDSVAIPDFAAGAMENWGLNTYRINLMVWLEEENTIFERWRSAAVIAHEILHQWFGNLVTCEWWNDTWLNEGFARYFQFIGANMSGENFRSLDRYVIDVTQLSMQYDESETTEPVHSNVTDRVVNQASRVVYEKAAALLRMMESFLTEETLIKGLQVYLKRHQYSGVVQDDLFQALTEQAQADGTFTKYTVKEVMDTWTLQSGFPIVRVSRIDSKRLYVSQERYRPDPMSLKVNNELWYIGISYVSALNPDFGASNSRPKAWLDKNTLLQTLNVESTDEWIIINPDARGFYRVIYDDHLSKLIQEQLERDHTLISFGSRSQLIDDYFKSASSKYINIQYALNFTRYLSKEDDFIVWTTVVNNLKPLYDRLVDTAAFPSFREHILNIVTEPLRKINATQDPAEAAEISILRTQLLDWACSLSHEICSEAANELYTAWTDEPDEKIPIPTDIQPMIYCAAVAGIDGANDFLLNQYASNRGTRQQKLIVDALACHQDELTLSELLEKTLDLESADPINGTVHGLQLMQEVARNPVGRQVVLDFITNNHDRITESYEAMAVPNVISRLVPYLSSKSTTDLPNQVEDFIMNYLTTPGLPREVTDSLRGSLDKIVQNNQWMAYYYRDIDVWLSKVQLAPLNNLF